LLALAKKKIVPALNDLRHEPRVHARVTLPELAPAARKSESGAWA
jgi:hypothetical protein